MSRASYSDPTANAAIAKVDREIKKAQRRLENQFRYEQEWAERLDQKLLSNKSANPAPQPIGDRVWFWKNPNPTLKD